MFHMYEFKTLEISYHKTALMYKWQLSPHSEKEGAEGKRWGAACSTCVKSTLLHTQHHVFGPVQNAHCLSACMQLHLLNTTNTACNWTRLWMMCYLVISRKLRRVERSSRRLICLWHWLQKKSRASSLRKLWKQSGRGAGALERGK